MPLDALISGRIATLAGDVGYGWVEAVGITRGRVAFAGSEIELETRADPLTQRIRLEPDEVAIPGLTDAHLHLADAALAARQVDLSRAARLEDGLHSIAEAAAAHPNAERWIEGAGWDQRRWGRWPTADDLERVAPGRRIALWSFDHHALWVSPAALALAGVDAGTPDPPGGAILRDDAPGHGRGSAVRRQPSGVLLENACPLVAVHVPIPAPEDLENAIEELADRLVQLGVVAVHDPAGITADPDLSGSFAAYAALAEADRLAIRVHACLRSEALETAIARGLRSGHPLGPEGGRARVGWLKLFADGTLGSRTSATFDAVGPDGTHGLFRMTPVELGELAERAANGGIASQIHAIGDHAARAALDALAPTTGRVPLMPRVEHVQLLQRDDVARFARSGIAASVQPVHLREDAATARADWGTRAEVDAYAWRTLADSGALIPFGTDAPVEPIDPWPGLAMAALRHDPSWPAGTPSFGPAEALPLDRILRAACLDAPLTAHEADRGRLVPGHRADLAIVPASALAHPIESEILGSARPRLVMIDGEVAFEI